MPSFGGQHPHAPNQGKSVEWYTPPHVFEAIGLEFDLDPCAPPLPKADWVPARRRFTKEDDGLAQEWAGRVWLNPPYGGSKVGPWVERLASHGNGIALIFSRTETKWFHKALPSATAFCLLCGRLTFIAGDGQPAPGNSGAPSMLVAWGEDCARAIERSGLGLTYWTPKEVTDGA